MNKARCLAGFIHLRLSREFLSSPPGTSYLFYVLTFLVLQPGWVPGVPLLTFCFRASASAYNHSPFVILVRGHPLKDKTPASRPFAGTASGVFCRAGPSLPTTTPPFSCNRGGFWPNPPPVLTKPGLFLGQPGPVLTQPCPVSGPAVFTTTAAPACPFRCPFCPVRCSFSAHPGPKDKRPAHGSQKAAGGTLAPLHSILRPISP